MKKTGTVLLVFLMIVGILSSCAASFPTKEHIVTLSNEEAKEVLKDKTEKEINDHWGEPDGSLSGFYGNIYEYNDKQIVIYFDDESKVADVLITH